MRFEFATATRIVFGAGTLSELAPAAAGLGRRAMIVTGRTVERARPLLDSLADQGLATTLFAVEGEPSVGLVCQGSELALAERCDVIIGFGGGSALDAAKAIAALATNGCDPYRFLEVIGEGQPLAATPLPFIAAPTTAGSGAEVTRNAVLYAPEHHVKVSLRSPMMLPRLAVIDPTLTHDLPPNITASTGLDALTQVLEPFVSVAANPMTDAFCREGLKRAARSLRRAFDNGHDALAREDMALVSLMGGLALANARLGAVHGFAAPIGGMFPAPHGAVCARLLPFVMRANIRALRARQPDSEALRRYLEIARILTGDESATAEDGAHWVSKLIDDLGIPPLSAYGLTPQDFPILVEKAAKASSMKGNPVPLTSQELHEILAQAL